MLRPRRRLRAAVRRRAYRHPTTLGRVGWVSRRVNLPPRGERRIEIGSGHSPRPGYLHVDRSPDLPFLDVVASADRLPFPDGWCDEILAVHMIEHVAAGNLPVVLAEWRRCLRPGGRVVLHTPNGEALARALLAGDQRWAVQAAVFGYDRAPADATGAEALGTAPDHKVLFTPALLAETLTAAGFTDVVDVSGRDPHCHHTRDWASYVPGLCLEMTAVTPTSASRRRSSRSAATAR